MAFFFRKQEEIQKDKYIFCALIAIELFMSFSFLGYIHIAPISLTFAYIPVLIAGCIFGPKEGFFVGAVFGLASMWKASAFYVGEGNAIFSPAMSGKPVESILLSVGARALLGFLVGLMYDFARKSRYPKTGIVLVSTIGRSVHTFCVYLLMQILFPEMGYTIVHTVEELSRPDYPIFILAVDAIVLFCYVFSCSDTAKQFMIRVHSVDKLNAVTISQKKKMAAVAALVLIFSFNVAGFFTNRIKNVLQIYGVKLSGGISYILLHLQVQFLLGMISMAVLAIIVIILIQKNSIYLYYEARLDGLTGLYSRQQFFQSGENLLQSLKFDRNGHGGYFVILDVDDFKEINDRYGHPTGDKVLKEVGQNLEKAFGDQGIIGRLGGDEFVVLVTRPAQPKEIGEILKTMKNEMAEILPGEKPVTCSIGVIPVEKEYSIDALYRNADRLLYEAKKNGKNKKSEAKRS